MPTSIQSREVWLITIRMSATPRSPSRKRSRPSDIVVPFLLGPVERGDGRGERLVAAHVEEIGLAARQRGLEGGAELVRLRHRRRLQAEGASEAGPVMR